MSQHVPASGIDRNIARARFDARRTRRQVPQRQEPGSEGGAPWTGSLRDEVPARRPGASGVDGDYDDDELVEDHAILRAAPSRRGGGRKGPGKGDMVFGSHLPETFDDWRREGRESNTPLSRTLDAALRKSVAQTSPTGRVTEHTSYRRGGVFADDAGDAEDGGLDMVQDELERRRDVARRAREYYSAASKYSVQQSAARVARGAPAGGGTPRAAGAPRARAADMAFAESAAAGGGRTSASKLKLAQERFKLKMWRITKALQLAAAHKAAVQSDNDRLTADLGRLMADTDATTTKRYKSEAKTAQLSQDRETTLSNIYARRRDLDNARASTRTWADKAATVLKQLKEVRQRRSARIAEAQGRVSMRGVELDRREKRLRGEARKLEMAVDDIRVELARKHEQLAVQEALVAEARTMHRSLSLHDENRLSAADVGAKRAARAKAASFRQRIALTQGEAVEAKQRMYALQDDMLDMQRQLASGKVLEKSSMAQLAMLHMQDGTEEAAVQVSRAVLRAQSQQAQLEDAK